jgi:hypothetical protein
VLNFVIFVQKTTLEGTNTRNCDPECSVPPFPSLLPILAEMADDHSEKHNKDGVVISELAIQADTENVYDEQDSLDPVYAAKAKILNDSLQEIGMGKYQVRPGLNSSCKVVLLSGSHP